MHLNKQLFITVYHANRSVGTSSRKCGENYNFDALPDKMLVAYSNLNQIRSPEPYNRIEMLRRIKEWKEHK